MLELPSVIYLFSFKTIFERAPSFLPPGGGGGNFVHKSATMMNKSALVFLHISKVLGLNAQKARFLKVISRGRLFIFKSTLFN